MPHYADGTEAQVGDLVVGKPYNTQHVIAGEITSVKPAESCNCTVAFAEKLPFNFETVQAHGTGGLVVGWTQQGERCFLLAKSDYGEVKAFTKVGRVDDLGFK